MIEEVNHPIEAFFRPRYFVSKIQKKQNKHYPKTVSKAYINLVKLSSIFKKDFYYYLENYFILEMKSFLLHKTSEMISDWEKLYFSKGKESLENFIEKKFSPKSKSKLIWSLKEIQMASTELKEVFK